MNETTLQTYPPEASGGGSALRKVLMIAYAFPPTGGPGVQRPAKFAKYLSRFGWVPTVWTVDVAQGLPRDASLLDDLPPDVTILTQGAGGAIASVRRKLRGFLDSAPSSVASRFAAALDWRLQAWHTAASFPDDCASWAKQSIAPLTRLIERENIEVIFSTLSPPSNHLLGLELKRRTHRPWVADFRDLWTDDYRYNEPSSRRRAAHRRFEQEVLDEADAVVGVAPRQTRILAERTVDQSDKYFTITNGFDPDDFLGPAPTRASSDQRFVLTYVGRLDLVRTHDELFAGLQEFADRNDVTPERFLLRIVGHANTETQGRIRATGLPCEFLNYVDHTEAVREMRSADALLLIAPNGPNAETVICAKVFEYLAARKPILVVGPADGECERIVQDCHAGVSVTFDQTEIAGAMGRLFDAWCAGSPCPGARPESYQRYSRIEQTRKLVSVFDRVAGDAATSAVAFGEAHVR